MEPFRISTPINIQDVQTAIDQPGLYVWYGKFNVGRADWHSQYVGDDTRACQLLQKALRQHSLKFGRQPLDIQAIANFSTLWRGTLKDTLADTVLETDSNNAAGRIFPKEIETIIAGDAGRGALVELLTLGVPLFQTPLYLGKAVKQSLRDRLKQHKREFLDWRERYLENPDIIDRLEQPANFAQRAVKLGFSPDDLYCVTLSITDSLCQSLSEGELAALLTSSEWLFNRWATPILGRR